MDNLPSKGLLPQIVDVLHALADSQELLTHKVRGAYSEYLRTEVYGNQELLRVPLIEPEDPCGYSGTRTVPASSRDNRESISTNYAELMIGTQYFQAADSEDTEDRAIATPNQQETMSTLASLSEGTNSLEGDQDERPSNMPTPTDGPETKASRLKGEEKTDHDYNFFDDLDARLAELRSPTTRADDGHS